MDTVFLLLIDNRITLQIFTITFLTNLKTVEDQCRKYLRCTKFNKQFHSLMIKN